MQPPSNFVEISGKAGGVSEGPRREKNSRQISEYYPSPGYGFNHACHWFGRNAQFSQENGDLGGLNLIFFSGLGSYQLSHEISAEGKWPAYQLSHEISRKGKMDSIATFKTNFANFGSKPSCVPEASHCSCCGGSDTDRLPSAALPDQCRPDLPWLALPALDRVGGLHGFHPSPLQRSANRTVDCADGGGCHRRGPPRTGPRR